jgi:hypothetical protein
LKCSCCCPVAGQSWWKALTTTTSTYRISRTRPYQVATGQLIYSSQAGTAESYLKSKQLILFFRSVCTKLQQFKSFHQAKVREQFQTSTNERQGPA